MLAPREDFPVFTYRNQEGKPLVYLDSAATTQKPKVVIDKMMDFYLYHYGTVHRAVYDLSAKATEQYIAARHKVKEFLGVHSADEIVFTSGTTDGINLLAKSFCKAFLQEGDEILISHAEHHSNMIPWQMAATDFKLSLKVIPITDKGEFDLEAFKRLLTSKTKLVSVAYMTNSTGAIYPVQDIIKLAHAAGAKVILDGAQVVGHMPLNLAALDVDFFVFSGHKMYGPMGVGVLYGKKELLEKMPPHKGGGDMVEKATLETFSYKKPPLRFESGTPMVAEVIGLGAAIDYLKGIGLEEIEQYEKKLTQHALDELKKLPNIKLIGDPKNRGSLITFVVKGMHSLDIGTLIGLKGVAIRTGQLCAEPLLNRFNETTALRVSFGIYNTHEDVAHFIKALKEVLLLLQPSVSY